MTEEKMIEEILHYSHSVGKMREVMDRAHDIMGSEEFKERRVDAYTQAYKEVVSSKGY
tara:strand:- start:769 stop:942 length:174 start_codon:yes stop_codon:yes gene_type:complete